MTNQSSSNNSNSGYDIVNENYEDIHEGHAEFMAACKDFPMPDVMDPRTWYKIEMQWQLSSCVGNAETGPIEVAFKNASGGKIGQFSRMYAYLKAQQYSDIVQPGFRYFGHDGGALIAGARRAAMEAGCCTEATYPYPKPVRYVTNIPKAADDEAKLYKILSSSVIGKSNQSDAFDEIRTYIGTGQGGILFGSPWPIQLNSNNTMTQFRNYGGQGHAQCAIGYLKDLIVCANSHDVTYGDKGFWYMTRQGCNEFFANRQVTGVGLSDLSVPRGRKVDWTKESMFS